MDECKIHINAFKTSLSEGKNNKDGKSGFRDKNMTLKNNFSTF